MYVFIVHNQDTFTELEYVTQDLLIPAEAVVGSRVGYPSSQIELDAYN